jgi:hypothetical protein
VVRSDRYGRGSRSPGRFSRGSPVHAEYLAGNDNANVDRYTLAKAARQGLARCGTRWGTLARTRKG